MPSTQTHLPSLDSAEILFFHAFRLFSCTLPFGKHFLSMAPDVGDRRHQTTLDPKMKVAGNEKRKMSATKITNRIRKENKTRTNEQRAAMKPTSEVKND